MKVEVLGAHNLESANSRLVSILIDDKLALDAGGLTSSLPFSRQANLEAILLTHYHFDHIRDVATLGLTNAGQKAITIYATAAVLEALKAHLFNGQIYPDFTQWPSPQSPSFKFLPIQPYQPAMVNGYKLLALPVPHSVPAVGLELTSGDGGSLFYSGDTGSGLSSCWKYISPHLLIIEVSAPNREEERARRAGHLTPQLLKQELVEFRQLKGYLPPVLLVHLTPQWEREILAEVEQLAQELSSPITVAYEGLKLNL